MIMFSKNIAILFCFVLLVNQTMSLLKLSQVDDNHILSAEPPLRTTMSDLFHSLNFSMKNIPQFEELSTAHNQFTSFILRHYDNLKEIAKLTRVDNKVSDEIENFMTAINELLNEETDKAGFADENNENIVDYVNQFLILNDVFRSDSKYEKNKKFYQISADDEVVLSNSTNKDAILSDISSKDTFFNESEFWEPDPIARRIYRGDRVSIKRFPFMASVQIFNKFHCSGCIIDDDLIITAASCLQLAWNNRFFRENPAFLSVRVGSTFYQGGGENIPVLEVYFHPSYNPRNLWNNLCILRLVRSLVFRKKEKRIKKIHFDRSAYPLPMNTEEITIVGWGARGVDNILNNPYENQLAYADLDVYPLMECREIYSKEYVTRRHFCAGFFSKGGGACNHDLGGPGITDGLLVGIISFGSPSCGTPDAPTVFTKLGYYKDWIESILDQDVITSRKRTTTSTPRTLEYTIGQVHTTSFEIEPIGGKTAPIPISDEEPADARILREFLKIMFRDDDKVDYEDVLKEIKTAERSSHLGTVPPVLDTNQLVSSEPAIADYPEKATEMGMVDPQDIENPQDGDVPTTSVLLLTAPLSYYSNINRDEILANIDESLEDLIKKDRKIDKSVKLDTHENHSLGKKKIKDKNDFVKTVNDIDLENYLANIISELDLKDIIKSVRSEKDNKALDDKIIQLFNEKGIDNLSQDSLTLLLLSDDEKGALRKNSEDSDLAQNDIESDDDDGERSQISPGMSIDVNGFTAVA